MRFTTKMFALALVALLCLTAQTMKPQTASLGTDFQIDEVADSPADLPATAKTTTSEAFYPTMAIVPGGTFTMGNDDGPKNQKPAHEVKVKDFYMTTTEITVAQFKAFVDDAGYQTSAEIQGLGSAIYLGHEEVEWRENVNWRHDEYGNLIPENDYNRPVVHVSWNDAMAYCDWLSQKTGQSCILPPEACWEYAACEVFTPNDAAGQSYPFKYAGSPNIFDVAWYDQNSDAKIHPVAQKTPNQYGLYDMTGNVNEWCLDTYDKKFYKRCEEALFCNTDPDNDCMKTVRGGAFCNTPDESYITLRESYSCYLPMFALGFRVMMIP